MRAFRTESAQRPILARLTGRIAMLSLALLVAAMFLHRLFSIPTPVALNLLKLSILGGIAAIVIALLSLASIWRHGGRGAGGTLSGMMLGIGLIGWPLLSLPQIEKFPEINDVTTDTASPPPFVKLAAMRAADANSPQHPGAAFASLQEEAYPDLKPLFVNRPVEEAYEIVADALRRQKLVRVNEEPPGSDYPATGLIEAYDRTLVWGFFDDVAVRVTGNGQTSQIDLRSASRYGRHDLGRNAERLRAILAEIVARLEATVSRERIERGTPQPDKGGKPARQQRSR
ncbi:MAG: DUF1499 domain-containing protein [Hyphomicrobiaceae bacterium]|nr:DUF1499 domain-containing protein [Hyphomicrobiaceae bacterium]